MKALGLTIIRIYKLALAPLIPSSCRYVPTCSEYGYEAIRKYGLARGGWMALRRIARCHPFAPGGFDPLR